MQQARLTMLGVLGVLGVLAAPLAAAAQTAPPAAPPAPAAPPPAAPKAPGAPSSASTSTALKLAGLVTFVANSCPKLQPDYPRFFAALDALGLSKVDLDKPDVKAGYLAYAARYNTDVATSCQRADAQFGPHGTTLAGIFAPR